MSFDTHKREKTAGTRGTRNNTVSKNKNKEGADNKTHEKNTAAKKSSHKHTQKGEEIPTKVSLTHVHMKRTRCARENKKKGEIQNGGKRDKKRKREREKAKERENAILKPRIAELPSRAWTFHRVPQALLTAAVVRT